MAAPPPPPALDVLVHAGGYFTFAPPRGRPLDLDADCPKSMRPGVERLLEGHRWPMSPRLADAVAAHARFSESRSGCCTAACVGLLLPQCFVGCLLADAWDFDRDMGPLAAEVREALASAGLRGAEVTESVCEGRFTDGRTLFKIFL